MTKVFRFIWQGVLAFDRVGSRIPQLLQIWLVELFFALPLAFFIGKLIDIHGALGVPGTGGSVPGVFWGALVLSLVTGFFFVRGLVRPKIVEGSWAPMVRIPAGDVDVLVANRRARVSYGYLSSHPSYALLLMLTLPIPLSMWPKGTGRGGNNFAGAGVLVELPSGGEALLLTESMAVAEFVAAMNDAEDGVIHTQGHVIDEITEDQREYYGLDEADFADPSEDGRVLVLFTTP